MRLKLVLKFTGLKILRRSRRNFGLKMFTSSSKMTCNFLFSMKHKPRFLNSFFQVSTFHDIKSIGLKPHHNTFLLALACLGLH